MEYQLLIEMMLNEYGICSWPIDIEKLARKLGFDISINVSNTIKNIGEIVVIPNLKKIIILRINSGYDYMLGENYPMTYEELAKHVIGYMLSRYIYHIFTTSDESFSYTYSINENLDDSEQLEIYKELMIPTKFFKDYENLSSKELSKLFDVPEFVAELKLEDVRV